MNNWLKIKLDIILKGTLVKFHVHFINTGNEMHELEFSNQGNRADYMGIKFFDINYVRVEPATIKIIGRSPKELDKHLIQPNGFWEFFIEGCYENNVLTFSSASYEITSGNLYYASFGYMNVESEIIAFQL